MSNAHRVSASKRALLHQEILLVKLHFAPRVHHDGLLLLHGLQPAVLAFNLL